VIEKYGGASRDRTDDLIVANDALCQLISFTRLHFAAEYGPLRSKTPSLPQFCLKTKKKKAPKQGAFCAFHR